MKIAFKEKTFEKVISPEIASLSRYVFPPDQVDEAVFGFDDGFFWTDLPFWIPSHFSRSSGGVILKEVGKFFDEFGDELPSFKLNLFLQYKIPVRLVSSGAGQWKCWGQPHYRYDIDSEQQEILEMLSQHAGARAEVLYASPAFYTKDDLWYFREKKVIAHTNFAEANLLTGHSKYSYIQPGNSGKAHSDAEGVQSRTLQTIVQGALEGESLSLPQNLNKLAESINVAVKSNERVSESIAFLRSVLSEDVDELAGAADSLLTISAFAKYFELSVFSMG